jgi:hypothetical protein
LLEKNRATAQKLPFASGTDKPLKRRGFLQRYATLTVGSTPKNIPLEGDVPKKPT